MHDSQDAAAEHARTASAIDADVGVEHIAEVYARALVDAAEAADQTAGVIEEFDALVSDVLDRFPRWEAILASELVAPAEKSEAIDRVLGGKASPLLLNFLRILARRGRLDCLRPIQRQARAMYDDLLGRVPVRLTTARPVSNAELRKITQDLRAKLGREPVFQQTTDPNIIGGAVLRIGDTVYDGSVARQLRNLRQQIVERSAHEIQSRRDRFRHSAGN